MICPSEPSPRAAYYQDKQCQSGPFSLNTLLARKTYDLDDWARIIVTIKHNAGQYGELRLHPGGGPGAEPPR
ncbi:MAG: hypothetical protein WKG07_12330 [Hymenobacter sp.]